MSGVLWQIREARNKSIDLGTYLSRIDTGVVQNRFYILVEGSSNSV